MEVSQAPNAADTSAPTGPGLSPFARAVAVFTNPTRAWAGLETRSQWWFPLVLITLCTVAMTAILYNRAVVPMITDQYDQMVESGRLTAEQAQRIEERAAGPLGMVMGIVPQIIFIPLLMMLMAAAVAFGMSFILGRRLPFRQAFEVVLWANLVMLPAAFVTGFLAWSKETMKGIHLGPGLLIPMSDPPEKWQVGFASFLDAFGPFEIWTVALVVIGASTLSGAPRKSTAWVIVGLYLVARLIGAFLGGLFAPGA